MLQIVIIAVTIAVRANVQNDHSQMSSTNHLHSTNTTTTALQPLVSDTSPGTRGATC